MSRISDVIGEANAPDLIYCLLSAYLESLDYMSDALRIPAWVKRFPIYGLTDVNERLAFFCERARSIEKGEAWVLAVIAEAAHLFRIAANRLGTLEWPTASANECDGVAARPRAPNQSR
ncbi:MAG: hypothetical protein QOK44_905 [Betaproteobacteria bacterium]|jgi:hypothetical protein|nr:hypothetical protein [Betaproteobacteria bacterium]